jgi:hypothetical protein
MAYDQAYFDQYARQNPTFWAWKNSLNPNFVSQREDGGDDPSLYASANQRYFRIGDGRIASVSSDGQSYQVFGDTPSDYYDMKSQNVYHYDAAGNVTRTTPAYNADNDSFWESEFAPVAVGAAIMGGAAIAGAGAAGAGTGAAATSGGTAAGVGTGEVAAGSAAAGAGGAAAGGGGAAAAGGGAAAGGSAGAGWGAIAAKWGPTAVGMAMSAYQSGKQSDAMDSLAAANASAAQLQWDIMNKQFDLSQQSFDFTKQVYAENKVRQDALDAQTAKINAGYLQDMDTARQRSKDAYDLYVSKGKAVQEKALDDALNYDSDANISAFKGRAAADVNTSYGDMENQQARSLSRMGVMPNANRLASINASMLASKAAASAGAQTNAEMAVRDKALALRSNGSNIAAALAGQAQSAQAQAIQAGNSATSGSVATQAAATSGQNAATTGFGTAGTLLGGAGTTGAAINNSYLRQLQINSANAANASAGFGNLAGMAFRAYNGSGSTGGTSSTGSTGGLSSYFTGGGTGMGSLGDTYSNGGWGTGNSMGNEDLGQFLADGGMIHGPGTGISDSVAAINTSNGQPIRVSSGEYVIPADVVRAKGHEFFDKLLEKHHRPAALQRKARG